MQLIKELLEMLVERRNHMGEIEYTSFSAWKVACKKVNSSVWFDGTREICNAFVGHKPYKRGETRAIGEWDGSVGSLFQGDTAIKPAAKKVDDTKVE